MKQSSLIICIFSAFLSANLSAQESEGSGLNIARSFEDMAHIFDYANDTTYVINFWATWCGPCVREMPYFQELEEEYKDEKFKLILVSLDFENQLESRLIPFLDKHDIQSELYVLLDGNANSWIDKVDPSWSGAIPITLVYRNQKRSFQEKEFHSFDELNNIVKPIIK